jgi:co-chaperonin GroES (HSP10)
MKKNLIVSNEYAKKVKMIMGAKATGTFILVEKLTEAECENTPIILPNGEQTKNSNQAYVVDVGPALEKEKWGIEKGSRVLLQGSFVPVPAKSPSGRELAIVTPHDVKAVLIEESSDA